MQAFQGIEDNLICNSQEAIKQQHFSRMSDFELLRFGVGAKSRSSQVKLLPKAERDNIVMQLTEARAEWNKRHPDLPLRDSF